MSYDYTFKLLLLGDASAEKTALTERYCHSVFSSTERLTIGIDFHTKTIDYQGRSVKLQVWDVGNEDRFRFLIPAYCLGASGAVILYDIACSRTIDHINEWISIVRQKSGQIPILLVGSKPDLATSQRQVPRDYGIQVAHENDLFGFAEVSSATGRNANQIFETITRAILRSFGDRYDTRSFEEIPHAFRTMRQMQSEFKINEHITLRFENNHTNIYIGGRLFRQCKYLLFNIPKNECAKFEKIGSIDEAEAKLSTKMGFNHALIPPETEFWGHCSNLQAWHESNYDTRILHRSLAFPLLKALISEGDPLAKRVFKEEIAKRLESGQPSVVLYLIEQKYLKYLNHDELDAVFENPRFLKNLLKWFRYKIPRKISKRIMEKLYELHCPYCGCKIEKKIVRKILKGKGIRCAYCYTSIIKDA